MRTNLILACAAACWCGAIIAAPAAAGSSNAVLRTGAAVMYAVSSTVCHQWDSHSFHLFGLKLPVCIRCSAIYFSFLAGVLLSPSAGRMLTEKFSARTLWAAAAGGMILDVALSAAGIASSTTASRLVTGGMFGLLSAFILAPMLQDCIARILSHLLHTHYGTKTR